MAGSKNMESFIANAVENKVDEETRLNIDGDDMFGTPRITIVVQLIQTNKL